MIDYKKEGSIHLVTMNDGPNMICADWYSRMFEILDIIEADCGKGAAMLATKEPGIFKTLKQNYFAPIADCLANG